MSDREARALREMYYSTRPQGSGTEVKPRIMIVTYALSAGYYEAFFLQAQKARTLIRRDFDRAFEEVDAIVTPTTPAPAFELGDRAEDPMKMYLADVYTLACNLAGL